MLRGLLHCLVALGALAATASLADRLLPARVVPQITEKLKYLEAHQEDFRAVFIGSSRCYRQVIPPLFDQEIGKVAPGFRSFNLGRDALWPPESFHLLRQVLAMRPPALKWVIFELGDIDIQLDPRNIATARMAAWHDLRHTRMALKMVSQLPMPVWTRLEMLAGHGRLWATRSLNLGRGADGLMAWVDAHRCPRDIPPDPEWMAKAGFKEEPVRTLTLAESLELDRAAEALRANPKPRRLNRVVREELRQLVDETRRAGVEIVFLITPSVETKDRRRPLTEEKISAPLLAFNDPARYPALYAADCHHDLWHLNERGAEEFTRALAGEFVQLLGVAR